MESTKVALESERRIQMLQMQAINALWKKVATMQPEGENPSVVLNSSLVLEDKDVIKGLAQTCNMLHTQVILIYYIYFLKLYFTYFRYNNFKVLCKIFFDL